MTLATASSAAASILPAGIRFAVFANVTFLQPSRAADARTAALAALNGLRELIGRIAHVLDDELGDLLALLEVVVIVREVVQLNFDASRVALVNEARRDDAVVDVEPRLAPQFAARLGRELHVHARVDGPAAPRW